MRINNNVSALNAWRNLTATDSAMGKNLERLSSGNRINRAADDAAGLAMSEKMRAQIKGMNQAIRNAQDGISMVQTAEGALNEVHTILQRMNELAVQAANGTNTGADRNKIQSEMDELASEVTRITNTTAFNSKELINGSMQGVAVGAGGGTGEVTFQIGPNQDQTLSFEIAAMDSFSLGVARDLREVQDNSNLLNTITVDSDSTVGFVDDTYTIEVVYDSSAATYTGQVTSSNGTDMSGGAIAITPGQLVTFTDGTNELVVTFDNALPTVSTGTATYTAEIEVKRGQETKFTDGYKESESVTIGGLDLTTTDNATKAITKVGTAINKVSAQRSQLGAMQNRLEHTINNLSVVSENLTAAESRIRDVDMAAEMTQFTKQQILMQAGTAMLAQANSKNQNVLTLLRG